MAADHGYRPPAGHVGSIRGQSIRVAREAVGCVGSVALTQLRSELPRLFQRPGFAHRRIASHPEFREYTLKALYLRFRLTADQPNTPVSRSDWRVRSALSMWDETLTVGQSANSLLLESINTRSSYRQGLFVKVCEVVVVTHHCFLTPQATTMRFRSFTLASSGDNCSVSR
jgi:hypothetical protein